LNLKVIGISLLLVGLWVYMGHTEPESFLAPNNIENLFRRTGMYGILGIGVAFVIITAGIDLSIGSIVCLSGCLLTQLLTVNYEPLDPVEKVFAIDPDQQVVVMEGDVNRFQVGDNIRYFGGKKARSSVAKVIVVQKTNLPDANDQLTQAGTLLKVSGLKGKRDRAGSLVKLHSLKRVDPDSSTVVLDGRHPNVIERDQIAFVNPSGGLARLTVSSVEIVGEETKVVLVGDTGSVSSEWMAMPYDRQQLMSVPSALLIVILFALVLGWLHGLLVTKIKLQPFVVTLCGLLFYRGISRWLVDDQTVGLGNEYETLGLMAIGKPCSLSFLLFATGAALAIWSLYKTAREFAGLSRSLLSTRILTICFGVFAAVIGSSRYWEGYEFVGGTTLFSLFGFEFTTWSVLIPEEARDKPVELASLMQWCLLGSVCLHFGYANYKNYKAVYKQTIFISLSSILIYTSGGDLIGELQVSIPDWPRLSDSISVILKIAIIGAFAYLFLRVLFSYHKRFLEVVGSWAIFLDRFFLYSLLIAVIGAISNVLMPFPICLMLVIAAIAALFLNKTIYGRYMLALGSNEEAARFSGINTHKITIIAYAICTSLAAVGGIIFAVDSNSVAPSSFGNFFELYAIAAAVLGGCSLRGGEGSILGVIIGTALMQTLYNLIVLKGISDTLEFAIIGAVILVGVIADEMIKRAMARKRAEA